VIICNKCGVKNSDETLYCTKCNNKLQSSRQVIVPDRPVEAPLEKLTASGMNSDAWRSFKRLIEAWLYVLLLAGVVTLCAMERIWWPLYPAVAVLGLIVWLRRP